MTYSKSTFFLFLTFFISFNIIADERAPSSQCYINGGWALEANIGKKIRELDVRPESLEMYIRSDNQIYLTLGKINRNLWKKVKYSLSRSYSCSSGKGYQKRVFVNNDYSSLSSGTSTRSLKGRVILSREELLDLTYPSLSSFIAKADRLAEQKRLDIERERERAEAAILDAERKRAEQAEAEKKISLSASSSSEDRIEKIDEVEEASFWSQILYVFKFIFITLPLLILEALGIKVWQFILGLFIASWLYRKYLNHKMRLANEAVAKAATIKKAKKDAKVEAERIRASEKKKKRDDTLKTFIKDYTYISLPKLEEECDKYLATRSKTEQSNILDSLKQVNTELKAQEEEEKARRKAELARKEAERKAILARKEAEQKAELIKKLELLEKDYGEQVAKAFASKKVTIGMPISYVKEIKGEGHDRKRIVLRDGESIKEKYGKYYKSLTGGKKSTNPSYKMEIEYERNEAGNSWLVVSYKDF